MIPLQADGGGRIVTQFLRNSGVPETVASALGPAIAFALGFVVVYVVGRAVVTPLLNRVFDSRDLDEHARRPLRKIARLVVVFAAVAIAFSFADYGDLLQSLATIAAAATLAIGLAMQDTIANFVAGVFIFTDRPFRIGDWIEWDDHKGTVEDISFRVTRVRTFDNELLTVPNSQLTDGVIKNPVAHDRLRLQVPFGIGYDDDVERATEIIIEEANAHPDILGDPAPSVRLTELGDSSVVLTSRVWIDDPSRSDFVKTRGEYVTSVKSRFDEEEIDIPYPNRALSGTVELAGADAPERAETAD
jgi:small-conductance mechanosensitive channel